MSVSYFGGVDLSAFDFVGFYETRQRDLARLSPMIGIPLASDVHVNRTTENEDRKALSEDAGTLGTLRSLLADDLKFYERARHRWD